MAKDAVATMGTILPDDAGGRDAVHVAVVSAVSDVRLRPSQDVGVEIVEGQRDVRAHPTSSTTEGVGKVDPYLTANVEPRQRFWLYLYPRSITGLNHHWSHPAFPDAKPNEVYAPPSAKLASEQWINNLAQSYGFAGSRMVKAAKDFIETGDYWCDGGTFEGESVPEEFWEHYERVTGTVVKTDDKHSFFTCSC